MYSKTNRLFTAKRDKEEHFMRKLNAWGLDANVLDFLIGENARIRIKDISNKWEYECLAGDMKFYGKLEEHKDHRPQYFLPLKHWTVIKANHRSYVVTCAETGCAHNFADNCLRGAITIKGDGGCGTFEPKRD